MRITYLTLVFIAIILTPKAYSQRPDWDKFRAEKISFITQKLDLTPEEAQKFWPVYNIFEKEKNESHSKRRELEKQVREENGNLTEKEAVALTEQLVLTFQEEADLMKKYNKKFLEVLPPQKVLKLYRSEHQFRMYMIDQFRKRRKD